MIGIDQRDRVKRTRQRPNLAGQHRSYGSESGRDVEIDQLIRRLAIGRNVFVSQTDIEAEIAARTPFILRIKVPGIAAEVIARRIGSVLHGRLLRQAEQEISEVEARARNRHAVHRLGSVQSSEDKAAARIARGPGIELYAPEISAPAKRVFPVGI